MRKMSKLSFDNISSEVEMLKIKNSFDKKFLC